MTKYRKKLVVVEAVQFDPETLPWPDCVVPSKLQHGRMRDRGYYPVGTPIIKTIEGDTQVSPGDWIIKGVAGEFYPCDPAIFESTYEPITTTPLEIRAVICIWCGETIRYPTEASKKIVYEAMKEHDLKCAEHPLQKTITADSKRIKELEKENERLTESNRLYAEDFNQQGRKGFGDTIE